MPRYVPLAACPRLSSVCCRTLVLPARQQILHDRHTSSVRSACCPSISPTVVTGGADGRLVSYSIETASVQWEELLRVSNEYHPQVREG